MNLLKDRTDKSITLNENTPMKLSTLMLASLMTLASAAAFAEDGSERMKEYYNNFTFTQQSVHGTNEQTAAADGKTSKTSTTDQEQPKS
ncbi:hypothetical protein ALP39_02254 [Pseudomonas marginalis pv. marginalis]|jgi:hypothetical protein|nr:hypothetical protein ALP39_02254 [Pseudomonas marginalis pv. marginalis]VVM96330.1 hypothetical protein PS664_03064 [Pseudomonas fluorescens]VVN63951.1 hypothetical protein PS687_04945 [Pseudomonas fluorescens]